MTTTAGVFLPDESEQQPRKKSPQPVQANVRGSTGTDPAKADYSELAKLGEQELKAAIKSEWKKHEESARADLAPLLYFLREQLRAQGARNDLSDVEQDRGFGAWVEENLDISRRTADRWCEWFAVEADLKDSTSRHVTKSEIDRWNVIQTKHKGRKQIAFNYLVKAALHAQFTRAVAVLQKRLGLKNKKEAMVQGVIYAAAAINRQGKGGRSSRVVGSVSLRKQTSKIRRNSPVRARIRPAHGGRKASRLVQAVTGRKEEARHKHVAHSSHGHRRGSGLKAMQAAAGR